MKSVKVLCVSATVQVFCPSVCVCLSSPFTFIKKSDCDITFNTKINLAFSVSSLITMFFKLLQTILVYVATVLWCQLSYPPV